MDAPGDANTFSNGMACGQVLSSIRPVGTAVRSRWPVWRSADRVSDRLRELEGSPDSAGLPDPVSLTVCPYSFSVLPTSPDGSHASPFQAAAGPR